MIDQSPIGRTPRSNPVTYIKAFDLIRGLFAATREAEKRGYTAGHFSFNIPGGRCETCQGDGTVTVEMQFLADVELVCEECKGTRFKSGILDIRYNDLNIHEVLQLTVQRGDGVLPTITRAWSHKLKVLDDVGLGYLRLGQSATTLSGGEAQRVKLAAHLSPSHAARGTLFIFDEPTTGLHFDDIAKLLAAFQRLIEQRRQPAHHRAQPGRDPRRRLGHRPRPRRRRPRRASRRRRPTGVDRAHSCFAYGEILVTKRHIACLVKCGGYTFMKYLAAWMLGIPGGLIVVWFLFNHMH